MDYVIFSAGTGRATHLFRSCLFSGGPSQLIRRAISLFSFFILIAFTLNPLQAHAQSAPSLFPADRVIDWSHPGVGEIPARAQLCARLSPSESLDTINAALHNCPRGQTVFLEPGTYQIPGTIDIPSEVTLRGAAADKTILNTTGTGHGYMVRMGFGSVPFYPVRILAGASAGATEITLSTTSRVKAGQFLAIAENNDPTFVTADGREGNCSWCDGWTKDGSLARGQIVEVLTVQGNTVRISPALYSAYTRSPVAVPFRMAATLAGVEDLQVYANNTGYDGSFGMALCARCWIRGVESNYSDNDYVDVLWGFHDEIRDNYFSNSFLHKPGQGDTGIHLAYKTSASLIENNIVERGRVSFNLNWGVAGNVIAYNFTTGEFIADAPFAVIGGLRFHGAHPQFNLFEGNVTVGIDMDAVWGSSSYLTAFRNWLLGTNRVCTPYYNRGPVECATTGHYSFQAARAVQVNCLSTRNNFAGNILGSAQMQSLAGYGKKLAQVPFVQYPSPRDYDHAAYGWSFGYSDFVGDKTGEDCLRLSPPDQTAATDILHGNMNNVDRSLLWAPGLSHPLPASLYLSARPSWWKNLPFPAIGPDIQGGNGPGGHSYGNPAERCYRTNMGGKDGGPGSPYRFNAAACY